METLTGNVERDDTLATEVGAVVNQDVRIVSIWDGLEHQAASWCVGACEFGCVCSTGEAGVPECIP